MLIVFLYSIAKKTFNINSMPNFLWMSKYVNFVCNQHTKLLILKQNVSFCILKVVLFFVQDSIKCRYIIFVVKLTQKSISTIFAKIYNIINYFLHTL